MTLDDVYDLFSRISHLDDRVVRPEPEQAAGQAEMWAVALADVPLPFAAHAVITHIQRSPYPLRPADIAEQWRLYVRDRLERHTESEPPKGDTGDRAYNAALLAERRAVAMGAMQPRQVKELPAGDRTPYEGRGRALLRSVGRETLSKRPELAAGCSHCHAAPGRPCTGRGGRRRVDAHPSRVDASRALEAGQQPPDQEEWASEMERRRAASVNRLR